MPYTEELTLIKKVPKQDDIGNVVFEEIQTLTYAKKNKVGSKEYYGAVAVGIIPTAELQIRLSNYNDEEEAIYKNKRYSIVRTIPINRMDLVLVLGIKQGVN